MARLQGVKNSGDVGTVDRGPDTGDLKVFTGGSIP